MQYVSFHACTLEGGQGGGGGGGHQSHVWLHVWFFY